MPPPWQEAQGAAAGPPVFAATFDLERPPLRRHGGEAEQRIGGHGGMQLGAEYFDAVVRADELRGDVSRDQLPRLRAPEPGFHGVAGEGPDLDHLAALRAGRRVDHDAGHQINPSSRQAESVTTTDTVSDQKLPSESCAIAITFPVSAMRARVAMLARPERGPRNALTT